MNAAATACRHHPRCPDALAPDHAAAHTVAAHPEQGWNLLCNGILVFDDGGELLPERARLTALRIQWAWMWTITTIRGRLTAWPWNDEPQPREDRTITARTITELAAAIEAAS